METQSFQTPERGVLLLQRKDQLLDKIVLHFLAARSLGGFTLNNVMLQYLYCRSDTDLTIW